VATIVSRPGSVAVASARPQEVEERRVHPILVWAALGVVFLVWQGIGYGRWIASGPQPTPKGSVPVPGWHQTAVWGAMITSFICVPLAIWFWLIKPWRKTGRLQFDGLMLIGCATMIWQDTGLNWTKNWYTYSSAFPFQHGSWYGHLPGWLAPNGSLLVVPPWEALMYFYVYFGAMVFGGWVLRKAKERWPSIGMLGMIAVAVTFGAVFDLILEPLTIVRMGLWTYPGAIKGLTIFHGHYYQFPIYEAFFGGCWFAGFALFRYYRNDRGETVAERGAEELRVSAKVRTGVRVLATIGCMNLIFLGIYNLPMQFFALNSDPWPADIQNRPYLTNMVCGPGTDQVCGGRDVPVARPGSAHINPNGDLVTPDGHLIESHSIWTPDGQDRLTKPQTSKP
jgi:hypothetical protein